ncbi:hypothetical protein [Paludibaculum fermentans]|uniref:hypothetical protein n=1 Tax=Paludibaculum fermentans TaxID=1473598 RepID=UPI003EB78855
MRSRRSLLLLGVPFFIVPSGMDASSQRDGKTLPPELRTFSSPAGAYVLELRGPEGWKRPQAQAELFAARPGGRRSVWTKTLPHRYGPALAVVSDQGVVLLIDEGVRTPGPLAAVIIARDGRETARYSTAEIAKLAGVTIVALAKSARVATWLSAPPAITSGGGVVVLEAASVPLELDLNSGHLRRTGK